MKYRTQAGVEVELSEEDLRKLRKTEEGKHTPEALFEKACRNIAHIADKKEDDVHDEKSIKEALGEIVEHQGLLRIAGVINGDEIDIDRLEAIGNAAFEHEPAVEVWKLKLTKPDFEKFIKTLRDQQ